MIALIILFFALFTLAFEEISTPVEFLINPYSNKTNQYQPFSEIIWISVNAFTSLGEGTTRPLTLPGLVIEFFTCFLRSFNYSTDDTNDLYDCFEYN